MTIPIVKIPPGEAPDDVPAAWVGLTLPVRRPLRAVTTYTVVVRTGLRNLLTSVAPILLGRGKRETGYNVDAAAAVAVLERRSPAAAAWWREQAPYLLRPGRNLLFVESVCEIAEGP